VRLKKCRFVNIWPYVDWTLDLTQFRDDQKLIALVGPNGRGKSRACEMSILGASYLNTPTQGTLIKAATAADSMLESTIAHGGHEWTIRHMIDAVHATSSVVVQENDVALWKKAGKTQFKEWAEQHLPQRSVVEASLFRYQKSEGFVEMDSAARIAVILRVIGVERLEQKAAIANAKTREEQAKLDEILRRIEDVRGGDAGVESAQAALSSALELAAGADAALVAAKLHLSTSQEAMATQAVRKASREAAGKLLLALQEQAAAAAQRRADAERRIEGNRSFQADAYAIRAAAARLEAENAALTRLEIDLAAADKAIAAELDPWRDGGARLKAAELRATSARARLKDEPAIAAAVAGKAELAAAVEERRAAVAILEQELQSLEEQKDASKDDRITGLRLGLSKVRESRTLADAGQAASEALVADDAAVTAAVELPKKRAEARKRRDLERDHLAVSERKLADAEKLAARAGDIETARVDQAAAEAEATEIRQGHVVAVFGAFARALGRAETVAAARAASTFLDLTRKLAARLEPLNNAAQRVAELEALVTAERENERRLAEQIAAVELVDVGDVPDLALARTAVSDAEVSAQEARAQVTKAEQVLARSQDVARKLDALLSERADVEAELADWTRLALDHGRKGMQSDEVDAAGPELTQYVNDCLRNCYSTRWTVTIETQRLDAEGKGLLDKCTCMVLDNQTGRIQEVKEHSGGERTGLAEAIASGLTMLGCRRAGFDRPTLVRDESTNFLDAEAAPLWVKMMRHVVEFTNADRLLFVSHNQDVVRLADATIEPPDQRAMRPQEKPQAA